MVLAAADPANPYGAALPWPESAHRPGRKAGALVALVDGELAWFLERGGRTLTIFTDDAEAHHAAAGALADLVGAGRVQSLLVEKVNGVPRLEPGAEAIAPPWWPLSPAPASPEPRAGCGCDDLAHDERASPHRSGSNPPQLTSSRVST